MRAALGSCFATNLFDAWKSSESKGLWGSEREYQATKKNKPLTLLIRVSGVRVPVGVPKIEALICKGLRLCSFLDNQPPFRL